MFEGIFLVIGFFIGVGVTEEMVVPAAKYTNENYIAPAAEYTKEKISDGVAYVKEKVN